MQIPTALRLNLVENFSLPQLLNVQIEKGQIECVKQCQTEAASLMSAFHMTPFIRSHYDKSELTDQL